jgi:hypothetical protein
MCEIIQATEAEAYRRGRSAGRWQVAFTVALSFFALGFFGFFR